jgi:putative transposase
VAAVQPPEDIRTRPFAIQHLALPKEAWLSARVKADWPTAGFPDTIHVDNGKDLPSRYLRVFSTEAR